MGILDMSGTSNFFMYCFSFILHHIYITLRIATLEKKVVILEEKDPYLAKIGPPLTNRRKECLAMPMFTNYIYRLAEFERYWQITLLTVLR